MTTELTEQDSAVTSTGSRARSERWRALASRWGAASLAFTVVAVIFGALFAWITPPFWGHDEITQFGRAYQVAHGGFLPHQIPDRRGVSYGGDVPTSVERLITYALDDYTHNPHEPAPYVQDPGRYRQLEDAPVSAADSTIWFTNTSAYSPVPYLPAAAGIWTARALGLDVGGLSLATRLAGLLAFVAIVGFGLHALRGRRVQWLVFTIAVLPITVFQAGTITADTMTNAVAVMVSALLVKALFVGDRLTRTEVAALLGAAVVLPLCKPTYVVLAVLVVLVPPDRLRCVGWQRWLPWGFAAAGAAAFVAWTAISSPTTTGMGLMRKPSQWYSVSPSDQLHGVVSHPLRFLHVFVQSILRRDNGWFTQFFGQLGFAYVNVPAISIAACLLALAVAVGIGERMVASHLHTALALLAVLAGVALIYATLYLSFTPVGYFIIDGVQGRYFVPLAIVALAVLLRWMPLRLTGTGGAIPTRGPAVAVVAATTIALIAAVVKYHAFVWG